MSLRLLVRCRRRTAALVLTVLPVLILALGAPSAGAQTLSHAQGELDCNGDSPIQQSVRTTMNCTDIRGFTSIDNAHTWGGRFYDNGVYIGHDEPDTIFYSSQPGTGNNVTWTERLGRDPAAAPTVQTPGSDAAHWFELSIAPWTSMMMCDPNSYPLTPCAPQSDANAPAPCTISADPCPNGYQGAGSAFMEMQFYPPGFAPFADAVSCDNSHWCAALTIDSLECTYGFATCNNNCIEPVNFAYIQTNGVPAGPPSPQEANLSTFTPNGRTLLMNPGDQITIRMSDASIPGGKGAKAFEVVVTDLTTHQSGFMQASAANGFQNTSMANCSGTPFNFQPEYNTAAPQNISPWAANRGDITTQFETGHFTPCTDLAKPASITLGPGVTDQFWYTCRGPYEKSAPPDGGKSPEVSDAFCFPQGDTHGVLNTAPDTVTGCIDAYTQNGDLDFDGTPYWPEWPTGSTPTSKLPGSFVESLPTSGGTQYSQFQIQTDLALSESTCTPTGSGCAVPPPNAPGGFYPYWSRVTSSGRCTLEFGNVSSGAGVNPMGQDAQYGTAQWATLGYPQFLGPIQSNSCGSG